MVQAQVEVSGSGPYAEQRPVTMDTYLIIPAIVTGLARTAVAASVGLVIEADECRFNQCRDLMLEHPIVHPAIYPRLGFKISSWNSTQTMCLVSL